MKRFVSWVEPSEDFSAIHCKAPVSLVIASIREVMKKRRPGLVLSDEELLEEFCVNNWATVD